MWVDYVYPTRGRRARNGFGNPFIALALADTLWEVYPSWVMNPPSDTDSEAAAIMRDTFYQGSFLQPEDFKW